MGKWRNVSGVDLDVPLYGRSVAAGDVLEVPDEDDEGLALQVEVWSASGAETKRTAKEVKAEAEEQV